MDKYIFHSLFSLFHHDIAYSEDLFDFDTEYLYSLTEQPAKIEIEDIANKLFSIITDNINGYEDSDISITLTGGMDSRVILAALLKAGVKPNCMTYGNPLSKDVVYAKRIADYFKLPFHNSCQNPPEKNWYYSWVLKTIQTDGGDANLHRAHRTAAIAEHSTLFHPKILLTGHMGGEGLRGLTYNNYFSSSFFEYVNKEKLSIEESASTILEDYFIKTSHINYDLLMEEIKKLSWMKGNRDNNMFFLYDLVAKIHHTQDIRLYQNYVPNVLPVFLQKDYLNLLFNSPYNFISKQRKKFSRLQNPYFYCKTIEYLYPKLLDHPLANGFSPKEYLRGLWYYVPAKLYRDYQQKLKNPPSFLYGKWFAEFVMELASEINPEIWEIYDKRKYFDAFENKPHGTDEGYWHKYSNPIFFDLVRKHSPMKPK